MPKDSIRRAIIAKRDTLDTDEVSRLSKNIIANLKSTKEYQNAGSIAAYCSIGNEVKTIDLINDILEEGKKCLLPRLSSKYTLEFAQIDSMDDLINNRFNILEPKKNLKATRIDEIDLVIVPLVAYTKTGQRIGMGGGYYDRSFSCHNKSQNLVGIAYSLQEIEFAEFDSWDINLNIVVNENGIIHCK